MQTLEVKCVVSLLLQWQVLTVSKIRSSKGPTAGLPSRYSLTLASRSIIASMGKEAFHFPDSSSLKLVSWRCCPPFKALLPACQELSQFICSCPSQHPISHISRCVEVDGIQSVGRGRWPKSTFVVSMASCRTSARWHYR
jgi:hypothetical protein